MMRRGTWGLLLLPWLVMAAPGQKHGLFWYETPPKKEEAKEGKEEKKEYPRPIVPDQQTMMQMHPKQIKKLLDETLDYAVYKMSPEATLDYYKVQDVMRRKAAAYTNVVGFVMLQHPELNGASAYPVTKPGNAVRVKQLNENIDKTLASNRDQYALLFFTQPNCPYCHQQAQILDNFQRDSQWLIKEVDILQQPEAAAKFNVSMTPVVVAIRKDSDIWQPVSVGVDSLSNMKSNLYRMVRQLNGQAAPQQFYMDESQANGFFDPMAVSKKPQ